MLDENKLSVKNLIYFLCAIIISIGLSIAFIIITSIELWSYQFWLCLAVGSAICFTGYRMANLTRPFTIFEYLEKQRPLKLDCIAIDAVGLAIIKRKREAAEEKKYQKEISDNIAKIAQAIDDSAKDGKK